MNKSAYGQDNWVIETLGNKKNGFFVEAGAGDGLKISNTIVLEEVYGWSGVLIEANPFLFQALIKNRRKAINVLGCLGKGNNVERFKRRHLQSGIVGEETGRPIERDSDIFIATTTLLRVLSSMEAPYEFDYLSLDVEGAEHWALTDEFFDLFKPKCITIEQPSLDLVNKLIDNGYRPDRKLGMDYGFVHDPNWENKFKVPPYWAFISREPGVKPYEYNEGVLNEENKATKI